MPARSTTDDVHRVLEMTDYPAQPLLPFGMLVVKLSPLIPE
jgi:hypothetical protein